MKSKEQVTLCDSLLLNRIPNLLETEPLEMVRVGGGEVGHAVVAQRVGQAGIEGLVEILGGESRPVPKLGPHFRLVVAEFPQRMPPQGPAKCRRLGGRSGLGEHRRVAELHVDLDQDQPAQQEAAATLGFFIEEFPRCGMVRRIRVGRIQKQVAVGGENHGRFAIAPASGFALAGSVL